MGGLREDTIETPAPAQGKKKSGGAAATATTGTTTIRFHEDPDTSQVHFHDDAAGIKAGVPVATWWDAWRRIEQAGNTGQPFTWTYHDSTNKTLLTVTSGVNNFTTPPTFEVLLTVTPVQQGPTFQKLDAFIKNRGR